MCVRGAFWPLAKHMFSASCSFFNYPMPGHNLCVVACVCTIASIACVCSSITTAGVAHKTYTYQFSYTMNQFFSTVSPLRINYPHPAPEKINDIIPKSWYQYTNLVDSFHHACNVMSTHLYFLPISKLAPH